MGKDTYTVLVDDEVVVPTGRRNLSPRVEDRDPQDACVGDELPIDPYQIMSRK